ncbi:MAG: hypothetical protein HC890_20115 [Chloroflexaceae bacterium]|nr:hypothetical protein [Chloroflexaceae bacterium]
MLFLKLEELERQGADRQAVLELSEICCSGRFYLRVKEFSLQQRQGAMELGQELLKSGSFCFVAESESQLILWKERKETPKPRSLESLTRSVPRLDKSAPEAAPSAQSTVNRGDRNRDASNRTPESKPRPELSLANDNSAPKAPAIAAKTSRRVYRGVPY